MRYVGIDLHKKSIMVCALNQELTVVGRQRLRCDEPAVILAAFQAWRPFRAVVEATASYEWLWQLLEPLAEELVLAHPKKLRIIAESTRKSDRLDAQVLAEFLARGQIPRSFRPPPRQRAHRALVRQRVWLTRQQATCRVKIRRILDHYNADRRELFTAAGLEYLKTVTVTATDRFLLDQLVEHWQYWRGQVKVATKRLTAFAKAAPAWEVEARAVLASMPMVGPVTIDAVLCELGDVRRFRSAKKVVAYAGLAPGQRESATKVKALGITKEGSRLLRWVLVEAAWRLVRVSARWRTIFARLAERRGAKKAIIAIARRWLTVMASLLQRGVKYQPLPSPATA